MSRTLQENESTLQSLTQCEAALARSQERYMVYTDLQHQLKMLGNQACCVCASTIRISLVSFHSHRLLAHAMEECQLCARAGQWPVKGASGCGCWSHDASRGPQQFHAAGRCGPGLPAGMQHGRGTADCLPAGVCSEGIPLPAPGSAEQSDMVPEHTLSTKGSAT